MRWNPFKRKPRPPLTADEVAAGKALAAAIARQHALHEVAVTGEADVPAIVVEQAIMEQTGFEATHPVPHQADQTRKAILQRIALLVPGGKVNPKMLDDLLRKEQSP